MGTVSNQDLLDLSGKRAIVTGGAVGIGYGISSRLAEAGAKVLIADLSPENINTAKEQLASKHYAVDFLQVDVSAAEDIAKMKEYAIEKLGGIDILINNAGIYPSSLLMNMTPEAFDKVLSVNLKGAMMATKAAAEQMIAQQQGGHIVNITSIDALHPSSAGLAHYDASKHGMWGFTKNVALELAPHNIRVNAVAPGGIETPGTQNVQKNMETPADVDMSKMLKMFLARIPMGRMGESDEIGKVVLFLCSDMSSYITGSQIVVDGGVLLS